MDSSTVAHWFGCVGEFLNLIGAVVLATDLLTKAKESSLKSDLTILSSWAQKNDLSSTTYKDKNLKSGKFVEDILHRRSAKTGWIGLAILSVGFIFLIVYHMIEIVEGPKT